MPERSEYPPGTFCWVDCATTDPEAAKAFYAQVLGWTYLDMPVPEGGAYSMAMLGDKKVAGLYARPPEMQTPSCWASYVAVEDAEATTARARELGATVLAEPFDVMGAGRMAVLRDPEGAVISLWQPQASRGAEVVNEHGAWCWNELLSKDMPSAQAYYTGLFGWTAESIRPDYTIFKVGERGNGGLMAIRQEMGPVPPHWAVYFAVDDIDASVTTVAGAGGRVMVPPFEVEGVGRIAVAADPQGATFGLVQLAQPAD